MIILKKHNLLPKKLKKCSQRMKAIMMNNIMVNTAAMNREKLIGNNKMTMINKIHNKINSKAMVK